MSGLTVCPLYLGWMDSWVAKEKDKEKDKEKKRRGRGEQSRAG